MTDCPYFFPRGFVPGLVEGKIVTVKNPVKKSKVLQAAFCRKEISLFPGYDAYPLLRNITDSTLNI